MDDKLKEELISVGKKAAEKQLFIIWKECADGISDYRETQVQRIAEKVAVEVLDDYCYMGMRARNAVLKNRMEEAAKRAIQAGLRQRG